MPQVEDDTRVLGVDVLTRGSLSAAGTADAATAAATAGGFLGGFGSIGGGFGQAPSVLQDLRLGIGGNSTSLLQLLNPAGGDLGPSRGLLGACGGGGAAATTSTNASGVLDGLVCGATSGSSKKEKLSSKATRGNADMNHIDVEDAIASELSKLSLEQRKQLEDDITGEALDIPAEEPEFVKRCLQEMDDEIKKLISHGKTKGNNNRVKTAYNTTINRGPYERAIFLAPKRYLNNPDFHLMFLRADGFNPKNAAIRLLKFFEAKEKLFGESKLCEPITLDDMLDGKYDDSEDKSVVVESSRNDASTTRNLTREIFLSGTFQLLPCPDRSGRPVVMIIGKNCPVRHPGLHLVSLLPPLLCYCYHVLFYARFLALWYGQNSQGASQTNSALKRYFILS